MTIIEFNEASYRLLIKPCGVPFRQTFSNKKAAFFPADHMLSYLIPRSSEPELLPMANLKFE